MAPAIGATRAGAPGRRAHGSRSIRRAKRRLNQASSRRRLWPDGAEDGVDGVALGAEEVIPLQEAVGLHVTRHRLDGVSAAHLTADGG